MALRDGVPAATLVAVLRCDDEALSEPVRLGFTYTRAVVARSAEAEACAKRWCGGLVRGLVTIAFAITAARLFPTLKYALGHGQACQRIVVKGEPIHVVRADELKHLQH